MFSSYGCFTLYFTSARAHLRARTRIRTERERERERERDKQDIQRMYFPASSTVFLFRSSCSLLLSHFLQHDELSIPHIYVMSNFILILSCSNSWLLAFLSPDAFVLFSNIQACTRTSIPKWNFRISAFCSFQCLF